MLTLMTLGHLPTRFSEYTGQLFGFVSDAEGFIFLSAFMVGWIYVSRAHKNGIPAMRHAVWRRAFTIYACQVGLLLFLLTVVAPLGAGGTGVTALPLLYSHLPMRRIVGSDIAHFVPLTLAGRIGHWIPGSVDWRVGEVVQADGARLFRVRVAAEASFS